jgi:hypothetical protein
MIFDPALIRDACRCAAQLSGKEKSRAYDYVAELEDEWQAACDLSHGPDAGRRQYWDGKAAAVKAKIERFIERGGVEEIRSKNRLSGIV